VRHQSQSAVLADPYRFKVFDPFSPAEPFENELALRFARSVGMRCKIGLPIISGAVLSENPLCSPIPTRHCAVEIFADDGVVRRVNDRGKKAVRDTQN
jgi:hypothetical protein